MKRILTAAAFVLIGSSCKKDYTCECVQTTNVPPFTSTSYGTINNAKEKDARAKCDQGDSDAAHTDCSIKEK